MKKVSKMEKSNKTALITGASCGIGLEFAKILASDNYNVLLVARNEQKLLEIKRQIEKQYSVSAEVFAQDLTEQGAAKELFERVKQSGYKVDVLINNAGFGDYGRFLSSDIEKQNSMVKLNVTALMDLSYYFGAEMKKRGHGKILNVSSLAAVSGGPFMSVYFATKAFVLSFSQALSYELAGTGVTVTALLPGPTVSGFTNAANMTGSSTLFEKIPPVSSQKVAQIGYRAMVKGKRVKYCGARVALMIFGVRFVPRRMACGFSANLNGIPDRK